MNEVTPCFERADRPDAHRDGCFLLSKRRMASGPSYLSNSLGDFTSDALTPLERVHSSEVNGYGFAHKNKLKGWSI